MMTVSTVSVVAMIPSIPRVVCFLWIVSKIGGDFRHDRVRREAEFLGEHLVWSARAVVVDADIEAVFAEETAPRCAEPRFDRDRLHALRKHRGPVGLVLLQELLDAERAHDAGLLP